MHSLPAASVATAAARAATLRPAAAVGGSGGSAGPGSERRCVPSPSRAFPCLARSLPPCVARSPPPAAGGCDERPLPPPPPPLTERASERPAAGGAARAGTQPAAGGRASEKLLICMNYRRVECSLSIAPHVIKKITLKTCFAEKTAEQNFHEWDEHAPVN